MRTLILALLSSSYCFAAVWLNDLDVALKQGQKDNKPILAYFRGSWCDWCTRLDPRLEDPAFEDLSQQLIFVKIDYPQNSQQFSIKQREWKELCQVATYPSLVVLSSKGKVLGTTGYPRTSIEELAAKLKSIAHKGEKTTSSKEKVVLPRKPQTMHPGKLKATI